MIRILANRTYRHLFAAQVAALVGTGLATVALGLLAFDLANASAGQVLGTALAIRMIANVVLAPIASAIAERLPRRAMLVSLDLLRAGIVICLPFVTQVWEIYVLIFALQAASASFTPAYQATIPEVLPDEADYTRAISLSRLAYDLESIASPVLAAALLTVASFHVLFLGTAVGFLVSAGLVISVRLPAVIATRRPIWERVFRGIRLYLAMPELRGVLALNLAIAAAGAMVIVNTVVAVKAIFGMGDTQVALALGLYGAGSILAVLTLPWVLDRFADRTVMLLGAAVLVLALLSGSRIESFGGLLVLWSVLGCGGSAALVPVGRILRRVSAQDDRPALFAAQFALSHACWLLAYPLAGFVGVGAAGFASMAGLALFGWVLAWGLWRR